MYKIVIYTAGTLGDHLPFIALGRSLKERGHHVLIAVNKAMEDFARRAGLDVFILSDIERGPEQAKESAWAWNHWHHPPGSPHHKAKPFDTGHYISQVRELIDLSRESDLLISTAIRSLGYVVHSAVGLPWLTVSLNPSTFWSPPSEKEKKERNRTEKEFHDFFHRILIAGAFSEIGIDKPVPQWSRGGLFSEHIILASSPSFSLPDLNQLQPRSSIDMTGFWFYQDPAWKNWKPDVRLDNFCRRRPIALSFSSLPVENPKTLLHMHVKAAARLKKPLLIQRGWAGFTEKDLPPGTDSDNVMFAGFLPHDWLFARASCSIQHGGIGSIARALRRDCPLLIEPFGNDQLFNASRVVHLGAGAAMHPFKMTLEGLTGVLKEKVLVPECREKTAALGAGIRAENGLETACRYIETYLDRQYKGRKLAVRAQGSSSKKTKTSPYPPKEPAASKTKIPSIFHQTWETRYIPAEFAGYHQSWKTHHPEWNLMFWTDTDNREFLRKHYSWFLPIYDNYPQHIMRVDAVRYFLLYHYGGVYIDMDFECLRPLGPLLAEKQLVLGIEPQEHAARQISGKNALNQIVCNAFMASVPGHPFWDHVFKQLIAFHRIPGPLDATGPMFLTRAYESYPHKNSITILSSDDIYPITKKTSWNELSGEVRRQVKKNAFAVHHWKGTWWKGIAEAKKKQAQVTLVFKGKPMGASLLNLEICREELLKTRKPPLISCLMVTRDRPDLARRAIHCFRQQTYPQKELIVIDDGEKKSLEDWVENLNDKRISYFRLPSKKKSLGELRNLSVTKACGTYLAQWDDDDLSNPSRLEIQMSVIKALKAEACFLQRHQIWWPGNRRLAISGRRVWESSFICRKNHLPPYPEQRRGEDTPVIDSILMKRRAALLDFPRLYTYVFHGANTFGKEHWERFWETATETYEGDMYSIMLGELQSQINYDLSPWFPVKKKSSKKRTGIEKSTRGKIPEDNNGPPEPNIPKPENMPAARAVKTKTPEKSSSPSEKVLVLTPVKDAEKFLPRFFENIKSLTYPHGLISLAFLESDSRDGTYALLEKSESSLKKEFAGVKLFKRDYAFHPFSRRWDPRQQFRRRSILAKSRNYLLSAALQDEDWVLWIDGDLARWPADIVEQLLSCGKEIVVPNCLEDKTGNQFDFNTFKLKPESEKLDWSRYIIDGILQPPRGFGRLYLQDLRKHDCVEVDGVGGTMLLIRADLHREGLIFPPMSYKLHIETEGLAFMARDMGYSCWGLPHVEIFHP